MDYIAQPKDYWIAPNAINITLNALGNPNRTQGSVASGAVVLCYIEGVDGLGYNNGHRFRTWPLTISPTYFNTDTEKYVYAAIPRASSGSTQAIIVFPSEQLDIYGRNAADEQVGSLDYYYIWLQGIITATDGTTDREWRQRINFGQKGTDEDLYDNSTSDWYQYSKASEEVTFLKNIIMKAGTTFRNLILGYKELTGVATSETLYTDSDVLVATPGYVENQYLSKTHEDTAAAKITFQEGLNAKHIRVTGSNGTTPDADNITQKEVGLEVEQSGVIGGIFRVAKSILTKTVQSLNFSGGDSLTGTGWQLTDNYGNGRSRLVVDDAVFRGKVTLNELEVRKLMAMGGNYVFSPAASVIEQVDYYGYILTPGEQEYTVGLLGYEYVKVPWVLRLIPLSLRGRYLSKKKWVRSTMSQEDYSRVVFYRCWLKADDGSTQTINTWKEGMLARCQTFDTSQIENGDHSGKYDSPDSGLHGKDVTNKLYWRAVTATAQGVDKDSYQGKSAVLDDGRKHNYIDLSNTWQDGVQLYLSGSDHVSAGDHIVCYGDWKDANLSHFVTIETIGGDAPAVKEFRGVGYTDGTSIDWSLDNKCKTKISPVAGNDFYAPHFYVETEDSVRDVATFMVSTDGIIAEVKGVQSNGKNLLSGVMTGNGWKSGTVADGIFEYDDDADFDSNGEWISPAEGDTLIVSPEIVITKRHIYTVSAYIEGTQTIRVAIILLGQTPELRNITGTGRVYVTTELTAGTYRIVIEASKIRHAQVELADGWNFAPTAFETSSTEVSSRIKQTADEINISITQGLQRTGVDITQGLINLIANKTLFGTSDGTPMIAVQMCDSDGNVWDGNPSTKSRYTIPSIVFYNGEIGQTDVEAQWVLNYLGFIRATNAGVPYSFTSVDNVICFEAPTGEKITHIGEDSEYEMDSENMALMFFYSSRIVYERMFLFNCGYYINDSGVKIYQPTNGKNYEMYNDMPGLRRYWLTRNVNNVFVPDLTTNATAKGYYCVVAEGNYEGKWPDGDQWHTVSSNTNRAGVNVDPPIDPIRTVENAIMFHLVYFDETSFSESGPAGLMERYEYAFVLFYEGWVQGVRSGIDRTCIAAIGGSSSSENNPTFYNNTNPDGICTIQKIIDKYNE